MTEQIKVELTPVQKAARQTGVGLLRAGYYLLTRRTGVVKMTTYAPGEAPDEVLQRRVDELEEVIRLIGPYIPWRSFVDKDSREYQILNEVTGFDQKTNDELDLEHLEARFREVALQIADHGIDPKQRRFGLEILRSLDRQRKVWPTDSPLHKRADDLKERVATVVFEITPDREEEKA